jgi:ribose 5-phosphate isomerase A
MSQTTTPSPESMHRAALRALDHVRDGMKLGLGTGRAAEALIRALAERVAEGLNVVAVPTSVRSQTLAEELGIPLSTVAETPVLDLAFDGADEVTPKLDLTKGLGGALLRERVIAHAASRFIVLVTPEKLVERLGTRSHIPIEVVVFAEAPVARELLTLGGESVTRRAADATYLTDNGNLILDTRFAPMADPLAIDQAVRAIPGVVDTGLFLGMASEVIVGEEDGVRVLS